MGFLLLLFGFWRELVLGVSVARFREDELVVASCCFASGGMRCSPPAAWMQCPPACHVLCPALETLRVSATDSA